MGVNMLELRLHYISANSIKRHMCYKRVMMHCYIYSLLHINNNLKQYIREIL